MHGGTCCPIPGPGWQSRFTKPVAVLIDGKITEAAAVLLRSVCINAAMHANGLVL